MIRSSGRGTGNEGRLALLPIAKSRRSDKLLKNQKKGANMSEQYKDRYSKAAEELSEKNAFICESCQKKYDKEEAEKKSRTCCGKTMTEQMKESSGR